MREEERNMLSKKEFLIETTRIINEEIKGNLFIGYKVEIPGKFNNSCFTIKSPDGLLKEYDIAAKYARYKLTNTSVNNTIGDLKETILSDLRALEDYREYINEKADKDDFDDKDILADLETVDKLAYLENAIKELDEPETENDEMELG